MTRFSPRLLLIYSTEIHGLCAAVALLSCLPLLFPDICPAYLLDSVTAYAGILLSAAFLISLCLMLLSGFVLMLRLRNTKALLQGIKWLIVWGAACLAFVLLAIPADVEAPHDADVSAAIQTTDTLYPPKDQLYGPSTLLISINPDEQSANTVALTPNLTKLENENPDVLKAYLELSPRWNSKESNDVFYSQPGHPVMLPPVTSGAPGLVHVCFRCLTGGAPLPKGYTVVKPGDEFPGGRESDTDLALDLGRNQFLLLAWRGTEHEETMHKAINAAIAAVDERMQQLADAPSINTIQSMLEGRASYPGDTPEIRLSEPPAQEGTYQAEIYANPHEAGTLLLYIKDTETDKTLRLLNCRAKHSKNENELFRHDIPGSVPQWARNLGNNTNDIFPPRTPLFIIKTGKIHQYFGVAFEVWFQPKDTTKPERLLLRRCYRVQPYEIPENNENLPETAALFQNTQETPPPAPDSEPETPGEAPFTDSHQGEANTPSEPELTDDATEGEEN